MSYEHPLAYLLGIEGIALLRAFGGEYDREFVETRLAEVRRLLDDTSLASAAVVVDRIGTAEGYRAKSATYDDEPRNLADLIPEAAHAANANTPAVIVWHFQLAEL